MSWDKTDFVTKNAENYYNQWKYKYRGTAVFILDTNNLIDVDVSMQSPNQGVLVIETNLLRKDLHRARTDLHSTREKLNDSTDKIKDLERHLAECSL